MHVKCAVFIVVMSTRKYLIVYVSYVHEKEEKDIN